jgi:hypothetical protein
MAVSAVFNHRGGICRARRIEFFCTRRDESLQLARSGPHDAAASLQRCCNMGARSWCASTEAAQKNEYGGNRLSISTKDHIAVKLSHRPKAHLALISAPAIEKCADEAAGRANSLRVPAVCDAPKARGQSWLTACGGHAGCSSVHASCRRRWSPQSRQSSPFITIVLVISVAASMSATTS